MSLRLKLHWTTCNFHLQLELELNNHWIGIYGQSGSGKTSMLKAIAGLLPTATEHCSFNDELWQQGSFGQPLSKRKALYLAPEAVLMPHKTALQQLELASSWSKSTADIKQIIQDFELEQLLTLYPSQLSSGQQQKLALAQALIAKPRLLLLDEALAHLDHQQKAAVLKKLKLYQQQQGFMLLWVSHQMEDLCLYCEEIIWLKQGQLQRQQQLSSQQSNQLFYAI
ncbi:ATP-binding cassette domain-containing protein [Rheinheimera faecalis]|uniref:ATP-binding cassette domain-containing protein n=1 Tax=Rheinheimera faecalis TaxID=2901141 RepID=UPI001E2DBAE7|nr:ATP-binding cassette domain-containing protein [Rheinheimera faecalis]